MKHVDKTNFEKDVLQAQLPVMVDFYADWCGPCKMIAPALEELAKEYDGKMTICKLNVDKSPELASEYGVMSIPTLIFFKGGKESGKITGAQSKGVMAGEIKKRL